MPRYRIDSLLGSGAMASVFRAVDSSLDRVVALKVLQPVFDANPRARQRFLREAKVAAALSHPNVVKLYDAGEEDGKLYLAMELVEGRPLSHYLENRSLPLPKLVEILEGAARGVHHANEHGIVHRDLKPANILVAVNGQAKVADFGLAHLLESETMLTQSGALLGTPLFMSPEQALGHVKEISPRSDVYALGAILYWMLTNRPPHEGSNTAEVIAKILGEEIVPPRQIDPSVPADLEIICLKALDPEAARRYSSAGEFADDLRRHLGHQPISTKPLSGMTQMARRARRHPAVVAATVALVIATLAGGSVLVAQRVAANRRLDSMKQLGRLWTTIVERKRELRQLKTSPREARAELLKAVQEIDRFIEGHPEAPQGRYVRARGRFYLGDVAGAEADVKAALDRHPDFRPGWSLRGMIKIEECIDALYADSQAPESPAANAHIKAALEAFAKGWEPGREQAETERWDLPWTREDEVMQRLAAALKLAYQDDRVDDARRLLEDEMARYRAEEYALFAAIWTKDRQARLTLLDESVQSAPGYEWTRFARASVKFRLGDATGAVTDNDKAIEIRPDFAFAYNNRGNAKHALNQHAAAIGDYDRAIELRRDFGEAFVNRGNARKAAGDLDGAMADYDHAVELMPDSAAACFNRANTRRDRKDLAGALDDYDRVIALVPKFTAALLARGGVRQDLGNVAGAVEDYDRVVGLAPGFAEAWYNRGNALLAQGKPKPAIESYDQALSIKPDYAEALTNRGAARITVNDVDGALKDLNRAIALKKDHAEAYVNRSNILIALNDLKGALADCNRAIELKKDYAEAYMNRGIVRQSQNDLEAAVADYDTAIRIRGGYAQAWFNRGTARLMLRQVDAALADFDKAIELKPDYAGALLNRGSTRHQLGEYEAAVADYERCLKVAPAGWSHRALVQDLLQRARARKY